MQRQQEGNFSGSSRGAPAGALPYSLRRALLHCTNLVLSCSRSFPHAPERPDPRGGWLPRRGSTDVGKSRKEAHLEHLNMWLLKRMASPWKLVPLAGPIPHSAETGERCPWSQVRLSCTCRIWCLCSFETHILKKPLPAHPSQGT